MLKASVTKIAVSVVENGAINTLKASGKGAMNTLKASAPFAALYVLEKGVNVIHDECKRRKREKTNKVLESLMDEALQIVNNKVKALQEDFRKLEEFTKHEVQIIRDELANKQGNKEMKVVLLLLSMFDKNLQEHSQKIQSLEKVIQKWPKTTKHDLLILRGDLENQGKKEDEIARKLESLFNKNLQELSQKIQTLKENAQEWPEATKRDLQLLRGYLENQEKEEQSSVALQCRMETLFEQLSQRLLQQVLQMRQEVPYHDILLFRTYPENMQGLAMQREEVIHLRVLELARGERINSIQTDSRSAFGIGPAQGAVRNRRLCEGQGFFRSMSGGRVEWITPGASDNLHANQDQRTACLDSLIRSIEGIQRSMDIRASRTNDLQVLMLTLVVLISIIILARLFTLPWP